MESLLYASVEGMQIAWRRLWSKQIQSSQFLPLPVKRYAEKWSKLRISSETSLIQVEYGLVQGLFTGEEWRGPSRAILCLGHISTVISISNPRFESFIKRMVMHFPSQAVSTYMLRRTIELGASLFSILLQFLPHDAKLLEQNVRNPLCRNRSRLDNKSTLSVLNRNPHKKYFHLGTC